MSPEYCNFILELRSETTPDGRSRSTSDVEEERKLRAEDLKVSDALVNEMFLLTCAKEGRTSEGRYRYVRDADGFEQWEYPAIANTDMDISTTPPHPGLEHKEELPPPPPPPPPPSPPPPPPRVTTPPPPDWCDPPPPGCDELPPLPPEPKQEIGDELLSFYNDIAEIEKHTSSPPTVSNSPEPPAPVDLKGKREREWDRESEKEREREKPSKKKSKVKISTSMGMKHKSVSSMVAKWQQVADEIHSD